MNWIKKIALFVAVILVSVGATLGTLKYLNNENNKSGNGNPFNISSVFQQPDLKLASYNDEDDAYPDFTKAVDNTVNGVVHIKSIATAPQTQRRQQMNPFGFFFGLPDDNDGGSERQNPNAPGNKMVMGAGSGVIISEDGYILTNNHVIDKATEVEIALNDNSKYSAKVIGKDPVTDIALLKIEGDEKFPFVPFGNSDNLKVGEWVIAVGNPFNLTSTVTKGIVSAKARGNIGGGRESIQSFIQTDAAINPGNSGGALVNRNGELVGINTAIFSQTGSFAGYGFAVPISIAGKVAADLKEYGAVQRAMLGVSIRDLKDVKEMEDQKNKVENIKINEGVYIFNFSEQSPAKKAGLEEGDVIVAINDVKTPSTSILQEQVSKLRPGDKVNVVVNRNNAEKRFDVVLTNSEGTLEVIKKEDPIKAAGVAFKELSDEKKKSMGLSYGVEVADTDNGGAFAKRGIAKGYVILEIDRMPIRSVEQANAIIESKNKQANSDNVVLIKFMTPAGQIKFEAIELK